MRTCARFLGLASLLLLFAAAPASAQIDVELAFDPTSAAPGEMVNFFASIANLGDAAVVADLELSVTFGALTIGPLVGHLPLAAGEELSLELMMIVPPVPAGGELTITVTASAGGFSDTATATLTVTGSSSGSTEDGLRTIGDALSAALTAAGAVENEARSVGGLKAAW